MHVACEVGCRSIGIEASSNRFNLSLELKDRVLESNDRLRSIRDKIHFFNLNCAKLKDLALIDSKVPSHIFSFNARFSENNLVDFFELLNKTNFKVLIINQSPNKSAELGLENVDFVNEFTVIMRGSK